ncbi:MAG: class I SAM-dependent methyltransferase [Lachnospiraceae bacterium]|nr:class I SAM-dependent methyltransferase [Lachnospiraceae bacterium]
MKNHIIDSYENSKEENRLATNNARRIEFLTTTRVMDELLGKNLKILDCAAGTGIYAFHLAEQGHEVTATDLTPRHVEIINHTLASKDYHMNTAVLDATDMSMFADESFDVVLNMGPFYHLIDEEMRATCLSESMRVLKKGGLLLTAYISRYYVFQYVAMSDKKYLDANLAQQLVETGVLRHDDEKCFWTDSYYATKQEMEQLYEQHGLEIIDHFAQDGLTPTFASKVDCWNEEEFKIWCDYHYSVCREESLLGASNHVVIVGRKQE